MESSRREVDLARGTGAAGLPVSGAPAMVRASPAPGVPLLDLNAQNLELESDLKDAFERVLRSGHFILGPEVEKLETDLAARIGVEHAIGVSSGTDAILLALMALEIGPGDEVICPTFTFFATAGCVARVGATPVFVDSCPSCFNLDPADVARRIGPRTRAVIPVHLFGQAADLDGILEPARNAELAVIEDGAQSLGARYKDRCVGGFGAFGIFSFFPSKNLGGFGDGGLVVTNDGDLAMRARDLRTHGARPKYHHKYVGGNFRLDPLQAALLAVKLPHYDDYTDRRRANAAYYTDRLSRLPGVAITEGADRPCQSAATDSRPPEGVRLILPAAHRDRTHIWNQYTLRLPGEARRDALRSLLQTRRIGSEIYYPVPMHRQECFSNLEGISLPVAEALSRECLSIPIYPELSRRQQDEVIGAIAEFLGS
jgi:dTDP-4-amino-4,6-dideoxygalactose transaminase